LYPFLGLVPPTLNPDSTVTLISIETSFAQKGRNFPPL